MANTKTIHAAQLRVGDELLTTNGMREVLSIEPQKFSGSTRPYRYAVRVQDVVSDDGTVLLIEPNEPCIVRRAVP